MRNVLGMRFDACRNIVANPLAFSAIGKRGSCRSGGHKNEWFNDNLRHPLQVICSSQVVRGVFLVCPSYFACAMGHRFASLYPLRSRQ